MTGSLQIKNNQYYAVLNLYSASHKRKQKWVDLHLPVKGNKCRAEKALRELIAQYEVEEGLVRTDMLFSDCVRTWLKQIKPKVEQTTYEGYETLSRAHILPYFDALQIPLQEVTTAVLQAYFDEKAAHGNHKTKGPLSARSLRLHKNIIHETLCYAERENLVAKNACRFVELPSVERFESNYYNTDQMQQLFDALKDDPLYLVVKMAAFYGLRRSEVLGLKWSSISFSENRFTIQHTVVKVNSTVSKDKTKNKSSYRSYPLTDEIKNLLLMERERQRQNRRFFGKGYHDSQYVFVWEDGRQLLPDYVQKKFKKLLIKHGLPVIRFHDLRHSCASILFSNNYNLKDVQEWLGHSDIKMTANVYGHLDFSRKKEIADGMLAAISGKSG